MANIDRGSEPERARTDRKPPVEVFVVSGAVFLFEREAVAPRSEIRKQAGNPRRIRHKKSSLCGGFFYGKYRQGERLTRKLSYVSLTRCGHLFCNGCSAHYRSFAN